MTIQGIGVAKDVDAGVAMLKRACDRKDTEACIAMKSIDAAAGSGSATGSGAASGSGSAAGSGSAN
jgi:hypothetical protein